MGAARVFAAPGRGRTPHGSGSTPFGRLGGSGNGGPVGHRLGDCFPSGRGRGVGSGESCLSGRTGGGYRGVNRGSGG